MAPRIPRFLRPDQRVMSSRPIIGIRRVSGCGKMDEEGAVMPRTILEPQFAIEHLSILDSDGNLDTALEPELSPDDLRRLYRAMLLGRRLDERMLKLQRQGRIGTFAPIKGQEASQIGSVFTLRGTDWTVPSFRETAVMLRRGWPIEKILLFFAGYLEGGQPAP